MLKKFLSKDLASQFTAVRSSSIHEEKLKFKPTALCQIMDGKFHIKNTIIVIIVHHKQTLNKSVLFTAVILDGRKNESLPTEPENLLTGLTNVLTNTYKWK